MDTARLTATVRDPETLRDIIAEFDAALSVRMRELLDDLDYFESRLAGLQDFQVRTSIELRHIYESHAQRIRKLLCAIQDGCPTMWDRYPD